MKHPVAAENLFSGNFDNDIRLLVIECSFTTDLEFAEITALVPFSTATSSLHSLTGTQQAARP